MHRQYLFTITPRNLYLFFTSQLLCESTLPTLLSGERSILNKQVILLRPGEHDRVWISLGFVLLTSSIATVTLIMLFDKTDSGDYSIYYLIHTAFSVFCKFVYG